jgi:hypothetical protein
MNALYYQLFKFNNNCYYIYHVTSERSSVWMPNRVEQEQPIKAGKNRILVRDPTCLMSDAPKTCRVYRVRSGAGHYAATTMICDQGLPPHPYGLHFALMGIDRRSSLDLDHPKVLMAALLVIKSCKVVLRESGKIIFTGPTSGGPPSTTCQMGDQRWGEVRGERERERPERKRERERKIGG